MRKLPQPRYERRDSDPAWLAYAVQFHGHLGPWAVAGNRLGMAGLRAVGAKGYFDVEVTCQGPLSKPPRSCFLDGLQVATGATLGKRNLHWVSAERLVVHFTNTLTGQEAEIRPTETLTAHLTSFKPKPKVGDRAFGKHAGEDHDHQEDPLESIARKIAAMPEGEILTVKYSRR